MLKMKNLLKISLFFSVTVLMNIGCKSPVKPSWGDQRDGAYRNPILNSDYPDVDIERFGDKYYMISSTIHTSPGMTLLESSDLVNWAIIGHVFKTLSWHPKYNWDQMAGYGGGVWAGDLARHNNLWYCYFIHDGLYVSSAPEITGPWSEPFLITRNNVATDPGVFWDYERKEAWLACKAGNDTTSSDPAMRIVKLFRMSWDGHSLLDEGKIIYRGRGSEALRIYKINGLFYVFLLDNDITDNDRKQVVLRGKRLDGALEKKVVLEKGNGIERSCSQGALVQTPDGNWWYSHQLKQPPWEKDGNILWTQSWAGRPQCLEPVRWENDWPVIGKDTDGNGIGNYVHQWNKPIEGVPVNAPRADDNFNSPGLGLQWQWNHNPRDSHWSLTERPGWLRLFASRPVRDGNSIGDRSRQGLFWNAPNTLAQRHMGTQHGEVITKMDISGMKPGQYAGTCHYGGQYVLLGIKMDSRNKKTIVFNHNGNEIQGPEVSKDIIYFGSRISGNQATFLFSFDNKHYEQLGPSFSLRMGQWRGNRIGFFTYNIEEDNPDKSGYIDIDWFRYNYDGPKAN